MGFKALKNQIGSLAGSFAMGLVDNLSGGGSQKDTGKVAAQLLKKGPFDIPDSPSQKLKQNPLSFSSVQYPLDLGTNELGHYIIFETGFTRYQPQQNSMFEASNLASSTAEKITAKTPIGSISNAAIAIYMPPGIKASYTQSYDNDTETGVAGDVQEAITNARQAETVGKSILEFAEGLSGSVLRQASGFVGEAVSLAGIGDPVRFTMKRYGTALNPRNEAFYNTPQQRTFSYTFDFWPRNKDEARAVEHIIDIFKHASAPGLSGGDGQFVIPAYFKISYMYNGEENIHLNKVGPSFCTSVDVDYAPDGQFTTFGGEMKQGGGQPVHTKMTVNFLEDRIVTKQDIEAGA